MRTSLGLAACLTVLCAASAQAQGRPNPRPACDLPHDGGVSAQRLTSSQRPRTYRLFVPPRYDGRQRLPLVLDLHGSGGNADGEARNSRLEALAASETFFVATLEAEGGTWNVPVETDRPNDVAYVSDVIDQVSAQACVDPARIYATGFSGGARMSSLLGCGLGARLAAIAPVSGLRAPASTCTGRPIPVITFHGLADPQNTYDGHVPGRAAWVESVPDALAGWAAHNKCKAKVVLEDPPGPLSTMRYEGCAGGAEVRLIRVDGLGHRWTHDEVDTTGVMWQFFKDHPFKP
jgi:polyhydroxybutyrate depolymerase